MKKLIFILLVSISFSLHAEIKVKQPSLITNTYNWMLYPMLIPNKKPIIKQKIIMNLLDTNKIIHIMIESNSDGLIEKVFINDELQNMSIDYLKKTIHCSNIDATIELDSHNYITAILDENNEQLVSISYQGNISYNQYGEVLESITKTSVITDDKSKISNSSKPDLNTMQSDRKAENLKPSDFKCIYSNHNEYGDWTSGYCMTDDNIKRSTLTRELEY
ncbi:hypothetical protein [Gilliamella sp. wkB112]|uniref:hypothetical protein n=1 Tax=Gilliamella sp. wkB112 TaxID=3120257 RepID=UPI00080E1664|nr:hypothetical protein [Gilliamella apicola]OCG02231.1 hypothetical protein A9G12_11000 [Gilliamella apicola]